MATTCDKAYKLVNAAFERKRLAHAFLISGPVGSGKETLAARMVQMVNPPEQGPEMGLFGEALEPEADEDQAGLKEVAGEYVRVIRPQSKSRQIKVEEVRELEKFCNFSAPKAKWKVGVIVDVDRLNEAGANAFLKTLEEPPSQSLLILLTTEAERLLPTIKSRCVELVLHAPGQTKQEFPDEFLGMIKMLSSPARNENEAMAKALAAQNVFSQFLGSRKAILAKAAEQAFKEEMAIYKQSADKSWLDDRENAHKASVEADYLQERLHYCESLISWLGDVIRIKVGWEDLDIPVAKAWSEDYANRQSLDQLMRRLDEIQELRSLLETNATEALVFEVTFLKAFS